MKTLFVTLSSMLCLLSGCGAADTEITPVVSSTPVPTIEKTAEATATPEVSSQTQEGIKKTFSQAEEPKADDEIAIMSTSHGDIYIRFFPEEAPKAVENFITHAKNGYYDTTGFHRVIPKFMIQGGDPKGNGTGGESIWGAPFEDEFDPSRKNIASSLSMANAGPGTNGSQFFINDANNTFLDGRHTVFGEVFSGMDTVNKIINVPTLPGDRPKTPVTMTVTIVPYSDVK